MKIKIIQEDNDVEESINLIDSFIFKTDKTGQLKGLLYLQYLDNQLKFIGCFDNNKLIGILGYIDNYLTFLFVEKEYQKQNIGHLLFDEYLKQVNNQTIYVDASKKNYKFYRKVGFITNDEIIKQNKYQMKYIVNDQKTFTKRLGH